MDGAAKRNEDVILPLTGGDLEGINIAASATSEKRRGVPGCCTSCAGEYYCCFLLATHLQKPVQGAGKLTYNYTQIRILIHHYR